MFFVFKKFLPVTSEEEHLVSQEEMDSSCHPEEMLLLRLLSADFVVLEIHGSESI